MAAKLDISDLADVVTELTEVTDPYQLGIQLRIDTSILKAIEKDHLGNTNRQKTDVIEYWLRNSPDASWAALASAVERMGGHANLVERLRRKLKKGKEEKQTIAAKVVQGGEQGSRGEE